MYRDVLKNVSGVEGQCVTGINGPMTRWVTVYFHLKSRLLESKESRGMNQDEVENDPGKEKDSRPTLRMDSESNIHGNLFLVKWTRYHCEKETDSTSRSW